MSKYRFSKEKKGFWYVFDHKNNFICNVWKRNRGVCRRWVAENGDIWGCGVTRDQAVDDYLVAKDWLKKLTAK